MTVHPPTTRGGRIADVVVTVAFLLAQAGLAAFSFTSVIALPMSTDNCAYVDCGDETWIWWSMAAVIGSDVVGLLFAAAAIVALARRRVAFWLPVLGCLTQAAMIAAGWAMAGNAGPI
ncbi:hypothetical protein [Mycobacterium sp. NPDC006124]|uniref:hypothetical protein n=1 Tax=Mycobacterium sp. NPDC006124 TaxID=3156729 RepID=UPI0033B313E5